MADFKWNDYKLIIETEQNAELAMQRMCSYLVGDIKREMKPGSYRPWPSEKGDGSIHWSSQPGDAPSPDTGELQDSISYATSGGVTSGVGTDSRAPNVGIPSGSPTEIVGAVGTQDEKGLWMEMGVKEANVSPRPFIRTALPRNKDILFRIFMNTMKRAK